MTLRVGMVAHRSVLAETFQSCLGLDRAMGRPVFHLEVGCNLEWGRNKIARSLEEDFLLFVDSDMQFSPDQVERLLQALQSNPKRGAVSACYVRWKNGVPVHNWRDGDRWMEPSATVEKSRKLSGVYAVDQMGGGLLLISKEAIEALEFPYFEGSYVDGSYVEGDSNFCLRLQAAGFEPSVHFGVKPNHIGPTAWNLER